MTHPYKTLDADGFWSRGVSAGFNSVSIVKPDRPILQIGESVASAGSCFASNVVPYLETAGFPYVRKEVVHPSFSQIAKQEYGYAAFSAAYGHIYTVRQMVQLLQRALGEFRPAEDRWRANDQIIDPFRPGLPYKALSDGEFDLLTQQHLDRVLQAMREANVFIFTLGLTECWVSAKDGAVFPACPGTVAGNFDAAEHKFLNLQSHEVKSDLHAMFALLNRINPALRILLTVSPVPLVATASGRHVVSATIYSKSVLVAAAVEASREQVQVEYFPSYEIITGPQAPKAYFEADRRNVSKEGIEAVMGVLLAHCEGGGARSDTSVRRTGGGASELSQAVAQAECEELAADRP